MATGTLSNAATGAFTADTTETISVALSNTAATFETMNTVAMNAGVGWTMANHADDTINLNIRVVNGATILAAADAGGTMESLDPAITGTSGTTDDAGGTMESLDPAITGTSGTTDVVSFTYVNLTADKATWDGASVEIEQNYTAEMKADGANVTDVSAITWDIDYDAVVVAVLSVPTEADITDTTATVGCSTDRTGTGEDLYYYISTSATAPSAADLKAGTGAVDSGSQTDVSASPFTFAASGLSPSTTYYTYFLQNNAAGDSTILESGSWATIAAPTGFPEAFMHYQYRRQGS
jgi:hypothetical protein